jgi:hypothetical protein
VSACLSPWWAGLTCDHLYADCPSRKLGEDTLRQCGWWELNPETRSLLDPHGADICGLCLHRHNRSQHREAS